MADAYKGIFKVNAVNGKLTVLSTSCEQTELAAHSHAHLRNHKHTTASPQHNQQTEGVNERSKDVTGTQ